MKEILFYDSMVLKQYINNRFLDKTKFLGVQSVYKFNGFLFRTILSSKPKQKRYLKPYIIEGVEACEHHCIVFFIGYHHNFIYSTYIPDGTTALKKEKIDDEELNIELKPVMKKKTLSNSPSDLI
jgi:hypothetical protein